MKNNLLAIRESHIYKWKKMRENEENVTDFVFFFFLQNHDT